MRAPTAAFGLSASLLVVFAGCVGPAYRSGEADGLAHPEIGPYLAGSHAHNDYDQHSPLLGALALGFASVEVDVALLDDELYVVHDAEDARPSSPTLTAMYLDPLRAIVSANGGSVYGPDAPPLQLLIDVKTDEVETHRALHRVLSGYDDILTSWSADEVHPGPVAAVLSGRRSLELLRGEAPRYAAVDGRIYEDRSAASVEEMPLVSVDWDDTVGLLGSAATEERLERARQMVVAAHAEGRRLRFWNTPDRADFWRRLTFIGVDYIGTDRQPALEHFLEGRSTR